MGQITLDEITLNEVDSDPSAGGGLAAPIGSYAFLETGGPGSWQKYGPNATDWQKIANERLLRCSVFSPYITSTATTLNGNLNLSATSNYIQFVTGTATGFSVVLPNATTVSPGIKFDIYNTSSQSITLKDNTGAVITTISQNSIAYVILQTNGTQAGGWLSWQVYVGVASGIVNYKITSTTAFTTSSTTDVVITGFTVTPVAGTYAIWYNASIFYTTTPIAHYWSVYGGGSQITDSARQQDTAHSNQTMVDTTMTTFLANGSQAIDVRVRRGTSGALTVNARTLILIRLGG